MKRILKVSGLIFLIVVVLLVLGVGLFSGPLIKHVVNKVGPRLLGVPVTLQSASFNLFAGQLKLQGLHIGNPEGFKAAGLFELGSIDVDLDMASLFKPVVVIKEIRIAAPEITYERALKNSNIGQLLAQLGSKEGAPAPVETKATTVPPAEGGKKVVIQKLTISGARVRATLTALGGHAVPLPLPPIVLTNIGGDDQAAQGVTVVEALRKILGAVFKCVTDVVSGAGKLAVGGVKAAGGVVVDGVKAVETKGGQVLDGVKNLIGRGSRKENLSP